MDEWINIKEENDQCWSQWVSDLQRLNMGQWWSDMNGYENFLDICAAQINSLQNYQLTMQHVCWWHLQYRSHESVVLCESKCQKKDSYSWTRAMSWVSNGMVFCVWNKCPVIHVEHMQNKWDEIRRCCNVLNWNINTCTNLSMISLCLTMERDTVKPIYLCVECEREFYAKEHLFRHSLVHKACVYCGKTSPKHKCHKTTSTTLTKEEALKPYLNSFHYKMCSK